MTLKTALLWVAAFTGFFWVIGVFGEERKPAAVSSIEVSELAEFKKQPREARTLIENALKLTERNLTYTYGSHDPARGGMDCSGTIYRVFRDHGVEEIPRSSYAQYHWLVRKGDFVPVDAKAIGGDWFRGMRPGDLMFWTGTYATKDRKPPISHVMMYLGTLKTDGRPVMFGASNGRTFAGMRRHGVSVFDFRLPREGSKARFVGYGRVF